MERRVYDPVWPIHVRAGLAWEDAEARAIARLLAVAPFAGRVKPVTTLQLDMRDVYPPTHWAVIGQPPAYDTPDEDVYLEGRNIVLDRRKRRCCARGSSVERLTLGPLAGNPFPDATPEFFDAMSHAHVARTRPSARRSSRRSRTCTRRTSSGSASTFGVPLELTLSCMNPQGDRHCGRCSKCRERQDAFRVAGVPDPTEYAERWPG